MRIAKLTVSLVVAMVAATGVAGTNGVMVASHRADWQFAPENSLASLDSRTYAQLPKVPAAGSSSRASQSSRPTTPANLSDI